MATATWPITISQQRSRWNAVDGHPAIRLRSQWDAQRSYTDGRAVEDGPATRVFIHISVTNPGNYRGNDAHAQAIERIGISRFPSTGISYNFGVMPNAALYEFQPVGRRGAHTVNDYRISTCTRSGTGCPGRNQPLTAPSWNLNYNARSIVICQNVDDPVTDAQIDKIARTLVTCYQAGFITRHAAHHPHGHRCVSSKSCPGHKMWSRMGHLHTKIHHYFNNGLSGSAPSEGDWFDMADKADLKAAVREVLKENLIWESSDKNIPVVTAISRTYRRTMKDAVADTLLGARVPNRALGEEGATVSVGALLSYLHEDAYELNESRPRIEEMIAALVDAQEGLDTSAVLERIDQRAAEAAQQRAVIAETMTTRLDDVAEALQGSDPAEAKLATIREILRLDGGIAPSG